MALQSGDYDHLLKLLLIGDTAVGKSSLLLRFTDNTFDPDVQSTIGVDFKVRQMHVNGKVVKATIWDTAGQERFRTLTTSYYRGAHGVILVYDVTNPESLENLNQWLHEVESYSPGGGKNVMKMLVGNKCDLVDKRAVSTAQGEAWARAKGMFFLESSAKSAENVDVAFEEMVRKILENPAISASTGPGVSHTRQVRLQPPGGPPVAPKGRCCGGTSSD